MNLLLTGLAVSNVFDGNLELDSGGSNRVGSLIPKGGKFHSHTVKSAASASIFNINLLVLSMF